MSGLSLSSAPKSKQQLLIIDDDPNNLQLVVETLDAYGFEVLMARTGERGVERAERTSPDLILLDVSLPGIDGYETCRRLATNAITRAIPVIFMSGRSGTDDKVRGFDVGGVDYVTKPIRERELIARVRTHLQLRALHERVEQQERLIEELRAHIEALTQPRRAGAGARPSREDPFAALSKRELEVTRMLLAGRSNKEIAYELSVSQTTISTHRSRVLDKLGLESLPGLIKLALDHGLEP